MKSEILQTKNNGMNSGTVLVIGAGFGGIAAALRMRAKGFDVTLVDRLKAIGGRAQVFERGGFRHDAGPTVITAPFLFDELFELFDEKRSDHVEFRSLDPWYRFYFHGGRQFDYRRSIEHLIDSGKGIVLLNHATCSIHMYFATRSAARNHSSFLFIFLHLITPLINFSCQQWAIP